MPEAERDRIVRRHQARYADFGPTLACEKLAEEGMVISPDTLVAILKERELWRRQRRRGKHRRRRERQAHFGMMVQMDGSHHDWFEGRGAKCVLMVLVDDATGWTYARFYPAETTEAAFDVFGRWAQLHGVPRRVYVDRHGIYRDEDHPEKPTQFGRAMGELQAELIRVRSPQAKGRVERKHRVFQDRLVKELRLRGISGQEQGNVLLEKTLLADFNRRYGIKPAQAGDRHRACPAGIAEVLCVQEQRVVGQDWCVRWKNRWVQIMAGPASAGLAGKTVLVKQLGDGKLLVERAGQKLACSELLARPQVAAAARPRVAQVNNKKWKPGPGHPYNRAARAMQASRARAATAAPARPAPASA